MTTPPFDDPMTWFDAWFEEARATEPRDPNAMTLSTVDAQGRPSSRVVLLKGADDRGFVFYTNTLSQKGRDLAATPYASLNFYWRTLGESGRQVRVRGPVVRVSDEEADAYFASRHRDSQLGAWASDQGQPLDGRETLEARHEAARARFEGQDVPRPPYWSGYRVVPDEIELWSSRPYRLHVRWLWRRVAPDRWFPEQLMP